MSSGSTSTATRSPATRSSAASSASTKATRSTRSRSSARRTASSPSASSRRIWRSSRPRARRPTGSSSTSTSRRKSTGELQLSAGFSSLEQFILSASIAQRNFMGKGQELSAGVNYSRYSHSVNLGFTEPYLFDKNVLLGGEIYRRDYNSFNISQRQPQQRPMRRPAPAPACALGFPVTEFMSFGTRYSLVNDKITLDEDIFLRSDSTDGPGRGHGAECDPLLAGRYLCDEFGTTLTSVDRLFADLRQSQRHPRDARPARRPQPGFRRPGRRREIYPHPRSTRPNIGQLPKSFILSVHGEGGYIHPLQERSRAGCGCDPAHRPLLRAADARLRHPRHRPARRPRGYTTTDEPSSDRRRSRSTTRSAAAPITWAGSSSRFRSAPASAASASARRSSSTSARCSEHHEAGPGRRARHLRRVDNPATTADDRRRSTQRDRPATRLAPADRQSTQRWRFTYVPTPASRSSSSAIRAKPRLSVGIGVNWISPFGPLRIDIAKALLKQEGDETKFFSFNVGTQF